MNTKNNQPHFIPGLILAESFFHEAVKPILDSHYPGLKYSAALIGSGSEVLGFDSEMSMDHHWGPRVMLFLSSDDFISKRETIRTVISRELPSTYKGFSTNFSEPDPDNKGVQVLQPIAPGTVNHRVEIFTLEGFFARYMNIAIGEELEPADWLTLPSQKLLSVASGKVFRDDLGLERIRAKLLWYPHDVWLYILASAWKRIGQEEHLMGRTGSSGDEIGSAIIGSRLVRDIMRLAFLMERVYAPYPKWFGTAFSKLKSAGDLSPSLIAALHSAFWGEREVSLCAAYEKLAGMHNSLEITDPISPKPAQFWHRPFKVIQGEAIAKLIVQRIKDQRVALIAKKSLVGNIDLVSDNTDLLMVGSFRVAVKALYT